MFKWFFSIIVVLSLAVIAVAAGYWYQSQNGTEAKVVLVLKDVGLVQPGKTVTAAIGIANNSDHILNDARLTIALPPGMAFAGQPDDKTIETKIVGDIGVGGLTSQEFSVLALSGAGSSPAIEAALNYTFGSAAARYEASQSFPIVIGQPAISLALELSEEDKSGASGGDFKFKTTYANGADIDFNNLRLKLTYPPVFKFLRASPAPDSGSETWDVGGLRKGSRNTIAVAGQVVAPDHTAVDFKAALQMAVGSQWYTISEQAVSFPVKPAPFDLEISANNSSDYIARPGDVLTYSITSPAPLDHLRVQLQGEMFDWSSVSGPTIDWESPPAPVLFQARVKPEFPTRNLGDKNFTLKVLAEGRRGADIVIARREIKLAGRASIKAKGYFRDAAAKIINRGPLPPQAGVPTNFSVHWQVIASGADVRDITVSAPLADGVTFAGTVQNTAGEIPSFDPAANRIVWKINRLTATGGVIGQPVEAVFQVSARPTPEMTGNYMPLLGETALTATDEFTGGGISATSPALTTALPDDATVGTQGMVAQ